MNLRPPAFTFDMWRPAFQRASELDFALAGFAARRRQAGMQMGNGRAGEQAT